MEMVFIFIITTITHDNQSMTSQFRRPFQEIPYGYCLDQGRIIRDYAEQTVIKQIIQLHQSNNGAHIIARILNESGIGTRSNGKWTYNQVRRVLDRYYREND